MNADTCSECGKPAAIRLRNESLCARCAAAIIRKWKDQAKARNGSAD